MLHAMLKNISNKIYFLSIFYQKMIKLMQLMRCPLPSLKNPVAELVVLN